MLVSSVPERPRETADRAVGVAALSVNEHVSPLHDDVNEAVGGWFVDPPSPPATNTGANSVPSLMSSSGSMNPSSESSIHKTTKDAPGGASFVTKSGGVLLSQGDFPQVPSALTGLTSVFGMGTGVTLSLWPPKSVVNEGTTPEDQRASTSECIQALGRLVPVG